MKKILMIVALFLASICLTACSPKTKYVSFTCTEYTIRKNASTLNILENYKNLELTFYENGDFKWVGTTAAYYDEKGTLVTPSTEEVLEGTYITEYVYKTDEDGNEVISGYKFILYYDNNPTEQNNEGGYPYYIYQGDTLTRNQFQVTATSSQQVYQEFKKNKN